MQPAITLSARECVEDYFRAVRRQFKDRAAAGKLERIQRALVTAAAGGRGAVKIFRVVRHEVGNAIRAVISSC
jgi:hypothetical protein